MSPLWIEASKQSKQRGIHLLAPGVVAGAQGLNGGLKVLQALKALVNRREPQVGDFIQLSQGLENCQANFICLDLTHTSLTNGFFYALSELSERRFHSTGLATPGHAASVTQSVG